MKEEGEKDDIDFKDSLGLEVLLLSPPTFDENQLEQISKTRKAIHRRYRNLQ